MINSDQYDLIIAIVSRGRTQTVMDAATRAGARGGTVLPARGTGFEQAQKFLGITIQPDREIVMIIAERTARSQIMRVISEETELSGVGNGMAFSLPVDSAVGLSPLIE